MLLSTCRHSSPKHLNPLAPRLSVNCRLQITTYNIHKGFSHFNRRLMVYQLRACLRAMAPDLVFLQEVVGHHSRMAAIHAHWPSSPQYQFLAAGVWPEYAYGKNAVYEEGHHGNAILSRFPISTWDNFDISAHRLESRGMLHCTVAVPSWPQPLHCVCLHLGLAARWRRRQLLILQEKLEELVPSQVPLIVAGDFNDWSRRSGKIMLHGTALEEVFELTQGKVARSFPAALPLFHLDRIYIRGLVVESAAIHRPRAGGCISDHAALTAVLTYP